MKLSKPFVGDFKPGQLFGQNFNDYYKQEGLKGHQGLDFPMPNGTPIISAVNGTVIAVSRDIQKGEGCAILSSDYYEYNGKQTLLDTIYWHLMDGSIKVNIGDKVVVGQALGLSNNTGMTTGPHLHFSVIPMDKNRKTVEPYNNGYHACVDPLIFLELDTATEAQKKNNLLPESIEAIKAFQSKHGLTPDGIIGKLTRQKLIQ